MGDLDGARASLRLVLPVALDRQQPVMLSSLFHETARLAFAMGEPDDAATLTGAVISMADRPEVTLATFITDQARELQESLVAAVGAEGAERLIQRGATQDISESLEITRRYLSS